MLGAKRRDEEWNSVITEEKAVKAYNHTQYKMILTAADAFVLHMERKNVFVPVLVCIFVHTFM